jgi:endonuclease YncB( thermonuclease family)
MACPGPHIGRISAALLAGAFCLASTSDYPPVAPYGPVVPEVRVGELARFLLPAGGGWRAAFDGERAVEGPIAAEVVRVIDGDTITVRAQIWIGQEVTTNVRLAGINAPELHGACPHERELAEAARRFLARRLEGRPVRLRHVTIDKYGGRVVARVEDAGGDVAAALLAADLVTPYDGGARQSWCG